MGFDMHIIKVKRKFLNSILEKYYVETINDLPYQGIEEIQNEVTSKCFESRLNLLNGFECEGYIGYAHETYTEINSKLLIPIIKYCENIIKEYSKDQRIRDEYQGLYTFLVNLEFNINEEIILYEHNC